MSKLTQCDSASTVQSPITELDKQKELELQNKLAVIKFNLSPNWITGFTDAEGCFSVLKYLP